MSLIEHARRELSLAGFLDKDSDCGGMLGDAVMKMVEQFAEEDHSGMSAAMAIGLFERVSRFEPITPLTGADDEWFDHGNGSCQNIRCSHVFKQPDRFDGQAYDLDGRVFRKPSGATFTSRDSMVPITFPYTPKTEYVDVPETPTDVR